MNEDDPIAEYVAEVAHRLPGRGRSNRRLLEEIECHLRERTTQLQATGHEPHDAARDAIARFGTVDQIVIQFKAMSPVASEEEAMVRTTLTVLVAITSLYAVLHTVFGLLNQPAEVLTYVKVAAAVVVIGCGVLVMRWQWTAHPVSAVQQISIVVGGLALIEIGTANMVWTAHLGLTSGDWEYYGFVGGALISFFGALTNICMAFPGFPELGADSRLDSCAK